MKSQFLASLVGLSCLLGALDANAAADWNGFGAFTDFGIAQSHYDDETLVEGTLGLRQAYQGKWQYLEFDAIGQVDQNEGAGVFVGHWGAYSDTLSAGIIAGYSVGDLDGAVLGIEIGAVHNKWELDVSFLYYINGVRENSHSVNGTLSYQFNDIWRGYWVIEHYALAGDTSDYEDVRLGLGHKLGKKGELSLAVGYNRSRVVPQNTDDFEPQVHLLYRYNLGGYITEPLGLPFSPTLEYEF